MHGTHADTAFHRFAQAIAKASGHAVTFAVAVSVVVVWAVAGPFFKFSENWQLVINTGTTIVTFLMVFLIQHSQNRDTVAMQLKLDELLRAVEGARNNLIDIENLSESDIVTLRRHFDSLAAEARKECPVGEFPKARA